MDKERIIEPLLAFEKCRIIAESINESVLKTVALQILDENQV